MALEKLVGEILRSGIKVIEPSVDEHGRVLYPLIRRISVEEEEEVVEALEREGVVKKAFPITAPECATHHIVSTIMRLFCPTCHKSNLEKKFLFKEGEAGRFLMERPEKVAGRPGVIEIASWYECLDCRSKFGTPEVRFYCKKCNDFLKLGDMGTKRVYAYVVVPEALSRFALKMHIRETVVSVMAKAGFVLDAEGRLEGRSGAVHIFDVLFIRPPDFYVGFDIFTGEKPADLTNVMKLIMKHVDIASSKTLFFIAVPGCSPECKELFTYYRTPYIEANNVTDVKKGLEDKVRELWGV